MTYVKDIMKKKIIGVKLDDGIKHISKMLIEEKINNLPVTNDKDELIGIVSEKDIIKAMESKGFMKMTAQDIMTRKVISVKENDSLEYVAKIFIESPYRRLPVTRGGKVIGMIARDDIINSFMSDYY